MTLVQALGVALGAMVVCVEPTNWAIASMETRAFLMETQAQVRDFASRNVARIAHGQPAEFTGPPDAHCLKRTVTFL